MFLPHHFVTTNALPANPPVSLPHKQPGWGVPHWLTARMSAIEPAEQLLRQALALDGRALAEIHDRYYPAVYRYVLVRLGEAPVAEDIASEAFLRLLTALQSAHPPHTNVRGWLFGTASHLIGDYLRRTPREQARVSEEHPASQSTEAEADKRLLFGRIRAALHTLTPEQQQVVVLRFGSGHSLEETAHIMQKTVGAVKVLQFRAMTALRELMSQTDANG